MEYGNILGDSLEYAKDALWGKWKRWILLILSMIIFPLIIGYCMEIWRGKNPAPEPEQWGRMFIDGLKLIVAAIIYAIPVFLIILIFGGYAFFSAIQAAAGSGDLNYYPTDLDLLIPIIGAFLVGLLIAIVVSIILSLFSTIGYVRMARTERFGEAFNFGAILATIRKIGWGSYILALIILFVVTGIIGILFGVFLTISWIGWIIWLVLVPILILFQARYICLVYDSAEETSVQAPTA